MKILYLSYDGITDPLGQSQILPYLIELSKRNFRIKIVSFEKRKFEGQRSKISTLCLEHKIYWIPFQYHKNPPILSTLLDLWKLKREVFATIQKNKTDIIHCRSYLVALIGLAAKRKFGTKFLFDMRGFWADERVEGKVWNLKNPIYKIIYTYFKNKERKFLLESDAVITLTNASKEYLIKNHSFLSAKITVINCCVDTDLFNPDSIGPDRKKQLRKDLGLSESDVVLVYLGSLGTWYMLESMLQFFNIFCNTTQNAKFLIVTTDSKQIIHYAANKTKVDLNKVIITKAHREEVPLYLSISHYGILFITPSFSKQASFPTKLAELVSMNLPIIANNGVGDNEALFRLSNLGVLLSDFKSTDFEEAVQQLTHLNEFNHLREFALKNFSLVTGVNLYEKVYKKMV